MKTALSASLVLCAGLLAATIVLVTMLISADRKLEDMTAERNQLAQACVAYELKLSEAAKAMTKQTQLVEDLLAQLSDSRSEDYADIRKRLDEEEAAFRRRVGGGG